MNKDEALRLALEALENSVDLVREDAYNAEELYGNYPARQGKVRGLKVLADDHEKAITAIKAALEAKDEPVWCGHCNGSGRMVRDPDIGTDQECFVCDGAGVPAAPVQEPVAWISPTELLVMRGNALGGAKDWRVNVGLKPEDGDVGLYTTPSQRKPLTDEEINALDYSGTRIEFVRAIEAAHGIKGEA